MYTTRGVWGHVLVYTHEIITTIKATDISLPPNATPAIITIIISSRSRIII